MKNHHIFWHDSDVLRSWDTYRVSSPQMPTHNLLLKLKQTTWHKISLSTWNRDTKSWPHHTPILIDPKLLAHSYQQRHCHSQLDSWFHSQEVKQTICQHLVWPIMEYQQTAARLICWIETTCATTTTLPLQAGSTFINYFGCSFIL